MLETFFGVKVDWQEGSLKIIEVKFDISHLIPIVCGKINVQYFCLSHKYSNIEKVGSKQIQKRHSSPSAKCQRHKATLTPSSPFSAKPPPLSCSFFWSSRWCCISFSLLLPCCLPFPSSFVSHFFCVSKVWKVCPNWALIMCCEYEATSSLSFLLTLPTHGCLSTFHSPNKVWVP